MIKERYVGRINIFHNAKQKLTAGEPVAFDANGDVVPATATECSGLSAQDVIDNDGKLSGSHGISLDSVTAVGRVGEPVGVYQGGVYETDMIADEEVAVNDLLYVDTDKRKLTKTKPTLEGGEVPVPVAKVELPKNVNGLVTISLLV